MPQHGVRRVHHPARGVGRARLHRQPVAFMRGDGVARQVDAGGGAAAVAEPGGRVEEAGALAEHQPVLAAVIAAPGRHVDRVGREQHRRRRRVGAARPEPHGAGIAGPRGPPGGAGQQQRVAVEPVDAALGRRQPEPIRHEAARGEIELAQLDGVAAAGRQPQHRPGMVRRQRGRTLEHPIRTLGDGQGVDVEQGLPIRRAAAIGVERGAPPQPARVRGVAPEIIQPRRRAG